MIALRRPHFTVLALLYAVAMIYSSLVLGPAGLHYVPASPGAAWQKFLAVQYMDNGSNQRPDWIANMMMPIPFAFLVNSAIYGGGRFRGWLSGLLTLLICLILILAIKYAQLFFPPRTVTLNYITAQTIGAVLGVVLFRFSRTTGFYPALVRRFENGDGLTIVLGAYTVWLFAYFLIPFDFVLSLGDVGLRALQLPDMLFSAPGEGRSPAMRVLVLIADTLATAPVGMFLAVRGPNRSTFRLVLRGFGVMLLMTVLSLFVLSADTFLLAIVYRTIGIWLGIRFIRKLSGKDLRKRHYYFSQFVPAAAVFYLLAVAFVSELFTSRWSSLDEALNALEPRQLLPFWNFYIVSKARAAESVVAHLVIYAPIGVMIWLRRGFWGRGATYSAILAFGLSLLMELGRWLKPGLRPDFSDPIIAAVGAAVAFKAMPYLWRMFEREAAKGASLDAYVAELQSKAAAAPRAPDPKLDEAEPSAPMA